MLRQFWGDSDRIPRSKIVALYDAEIAYVDSLISTVLETLDDMGIGENTLVIFTADHGEEMFQRNRYFFHQCSIYDSVLRIPLILRLPGRIASGIVPVDPVESLDIAPTILDFVGLESPADFKGRSLRSRIASSAPDDDFSSPITSYAEIGGDIGSVRTADWRFIENPGGTIPQAGRGEEGRSCYSIQQAELYDLQSDPDEQENAIERYPQVAAELRDLLHAWRDSAQQARSDETDIPEETLKELRALGYIQ